MEIELTKDEVLDAATVGIKRQTSSLFKKSKNRFEINPKEEWGIHVIGAMGELAVAKGLNREWPRGVDTYKKADIEPNIQVRTGLKDDAGLVVRDGDKDDEVYVLVTGTGPKFIIRGYIKGKDARRKEWYKAPNGNKPAHFVPQNKLLPIEDLIKEK